MATQGAFTLLWDNLSPHLAGHADTAMVEQRVNQLLLLQVLALQGFRRLKGFQTRLEGVQTPGGAAGRGRASAVECKLMKSRARAVPGRV